jgi:hypothetical protein
VAVAENHNGRQHSKRNSIKCNFFELAEILIVSYDELDAVEIKQYLQFKHA